MSRGSPGGERRYWYLAVLTLVVLDPLTTAVAVRTGVGVEANAVLAGFVARGEWASVVALKTLAVAAAWAVWHVVREWQFRAVVPRLAAAMGSFAVLNNVAVLIVSGAGPFGTALFGVGVA